MECIMINYKQLAGEKLMALAPYSPGKPVKEVQRELGIEKIVKLASNENPFGASPKAFEALKQLEQDVTRYPLGDAYYLRTAISEKHGVPMDSILCGAGSDEIIQLLYIAFLQQGTNVVSPAPSFSEYYILAASLRCECRWVDSNPDFTTNFDNILAAVDENTRFVMLANPNNPTGLAFTQADLVAFLDKLSSDVMVVMDEAYIEFANYEDMPDVLSLMKKYKNLMTMRTFSKAYGLASVRCGYLIADPECVDCVQRTRPPFNVSVPAQLMAEAAIKDSDFLNDVVAKNDACKKYLYQSFEAMGVEYVPTEANFMLAKVGNGQSIFNELLKEGVIVRFIGEPTLKEYIRVSVGTMEENEIFVSKLKKVLGK